MLTLVQRLIGGKKATRAVPEGTRVYAIGDVHGCLPQLNTLLTKIETDRAGYGGKIQLVFLGDYVDRGQDSKGVIDRVLAIRGRYETHAVRGNHDQTLLDFLDNPMLFREWRDYGARETLMSYGVKPPVFDNEEAFTEARDALRRAMPASHVEFLRALPYAVEIGDYFFTHAGVRAGVSLENQVPEDLLWIRDDFLMSDVNFGKTIVHGHTPTDAPVQRKHRIGIDTGTYVTGRLTAAVLEGSDCRFLMT